MKNELLRRAREERGWTRETLGRKIGSTGRSVGSWERGERFTSPIFRERLCELLGKSPEQLGLMEMEEVGEEVGKEVQELKKRLPPRLDENQRKMIQRVRARWITGVLENPLHLATLIIPGLREQPDAVINPWRLVVQESDKPPRLLPLGTRLTDVYDEYDELLVLGEPGAGKTTLLLDLTRDLLERCEGNGENVPPVVFNLSSWAEKSSSLEDWLIEELSMRYQVPRSLGQKWIERDQIFPLLDGLDEVTESVRTACVDEINNYRQRHGMVSLVVCSRSDDYFDQSARLLLHTAVIVQPLTTEQIDAYLSEAGEELAVVRVALQHDQILREMASTPLMLSTMAFTYRGFSMDEILAEDSLTERRRTMLKNYVERVLELRGSKKKGYDSQQIIRYLSWLARQMAAHNQTEFYIERLQPDWLSESRQRHYQNTMLRMIYGMGSALNGGLFAWIFGGKPEPGNNRGVGDGLLGWLGSGPGNHVLGWMAPGLGGGLEGGAMLGLILGLVLQISAIVIDEEMMRWTWALIRRSFLRGLFSGLRNGLISFVVAAIFCGLLFWNSSHDIQHALSYGLGFAIASGLSVGLVSVLVSSLTANRNQIGDQRMGLGITLVNGVIMGLCGGISFGVVEALLVNIEQGATFGAIVAIVYSVIFSFGGTRAIRGIGREIKPAETGIWNWQAVKSDLLMLMTEGLIIGLFIWVVVMVIIGFAGSFFYGPAYGWRYGLVYGVIVGLSTGVAIVMTGILNSLWRSELLEERYLIRPNEGIRRSVQNSAFAGSLFGVLGGIATGTIVGLAFWLLGGLSGWVILGTGFAIILGAGFVFNFSMLRGGIAAIEHYTLRWYLWRCGSLPWNVVRFLDYASERILLRKVGGGYIFLHRLLLEYFASIE
jgi:transcriptional regulator with XRE-family HTH domain/GTPase SAR1 family protein